MQVVKLTDKFFFNHSYTRAFNGLNYLVLDNNYCYAIKKTLEPEEYTVVPDCELEQTQEKFLKYLRELAKYNK